MWGQYKLELRMRNHSTHDRATVLQELAAAVAGGHTVALDDPEVFVLVEVFKSVCGVGVVQDYYGRAKFNVIELAQAHAAVNRPGDDAAGEDAAGDRGGNTPSG
jgi:tRNA acetyltransferase TAN1